MMFDLLRRDSESDGAEVNLLVGLDTGEDYEQP